MNTTNKTIQFGENVEGYNIPVLNEREIRAAAGILFLFMFISIMVAIFTGNFLMLKYMITIFLADMLLRVFVNPKFSPLLIMGRLMVNKQVPLYVGAPQKRFAWIIGITLSSIMLLLIVIVNSFSPITGIICLICLIFLFFETAFNICIGCKLYGLFYKEKAQYCPGEICEVDARQDIQKTSKTQIVIIFGLITYIVLMVFMFNDYFSEVPNDLWDIIATEKK